MFCGFAPKKSKMNCRRLINCKIPYSNTEQNPVDSSTQMWDIHYAKRKSCKK